MVSLAVDSDARAAGRRAVGFLVSANVIYRMSSTFDVDALPTVESPWERDVAPDWSMWFRQVTPDECDELPEGTSGSVAVELVQKNVWVVTLIKPVQEVGGMSVVDTTEHESFEQACARVRDLLESLGGRKD
jgi:hypothetical protein